MLLFPANTSIMNTVITHISGCEYTWAHKFDTRVTKHHIKLYCVNDANSGSVANLQGNHGSLIVQLVATVNKICFN